MNPFVSIITCTYNRSTFFDNIKNIVKTQDYPHDRLEWIIMDDSLESSDHLFEPLMDGIQVRYLHLKQKIPLARKRTLLNHLAKGTYIVNMDDDDYYPACRVSHAVERLVQSGAHLAGSSIMFMYFTVDRSIYQLGPYGPNHGTAATMAYSKAYTETHDFGNGDYAEEAIFTEKWANKMVQLDPMKSVLALSHSNNTIDKTIFLKEKYGQLGKTINITNKKLEDFITDSTIIDFYKALTFEYKENKYTKDVIDKLETELTRATENAYINYSNFVCENIVKDLLIIRERTDKLRHFGVTV